MASVECQVCAARSWLSSAGVSATYYTRLEQGQSTNASESVIDAIASALDLDDDERTHLHDLARPVRAKRRRAPRPDVARPGIARLVDAMGDVPALVMGRRSEVLAWNRLGHALLAGHYAIDAPSRPTERPNLTQMLFLDPHTRDLYARWEDEAARAVASLRLIAGRYRDDRLLADLVGELMLKDDDFRLAVGPPSGPQLHDRHQGLPPSRGRRLRARLRSPAAARRERASRPDLYRVTRDRFGGRHSAPVHRSYPTGSAASLPAYGRA